MAKGTKLLGKKRETREEEEEVFFLNNLGLARILQDKAGKGKEARKGR